MSTHFLIQAERSPLLPISDIAPSVECAAVIEAIDEHNWLRPEDQISCTVTSLGAVKSNVYTNSEAKKMIPVGSVEFVEEFMKRAFRISGIEPINVPMALQKRSLWGRRIAVGAGRDAILSAMDEWGCDSLFIKSASRIKCDFAGVYKKTDTLPNTDDLLLFSTPIDIESEWRVFVFHGCMRDIRPYLGNVWATPDKMVIEEIIDSFGREYPAYTLDVAVTTSGETVIVELHNFISCGLYGATVPIMMYKAGFRSELKRRGISVEDP